MAEDDVVAIAKKTLFTDRDQLSAHARRPLQADARRIRSTPGRTREIGALMPCDDGNVELRIERIDQGTSNTRVFERADGLISQAQGVAIHSPAQLCGRRSVADLPHPLG